MPRELTEKQRQALDEGRRKMTPAKRAALELGRAGAGNRRAVRHGGYAEVVAERLDAKAAELFDALEADAPLRAPGGGLPPADTAAVSMLARAMCRLEDVEADIRAHGWRDAETGEARPLLERERELRREIGDWLDALGMTPRSRSRLGVDLARTVDLASAMSERDPERRARLLEEAGLPAGEEVAGDG